VHAGEHTLTHGSIFWLLVLPDGAIAAFHVAVQRRLEHHHEGSIEAMTHLPERIPEHQSLLHGFAFTESLVSDSRAIRLERLRFVCLLEAMQSRRDEANSSS